MSFGSCFPNVLGILYGFFIIFLNSAEKNSYENLKSTDFEADILVWLHLCTYLYYIKKIIMILEFAESLNE